MILHETFTGHLVEVVIASCHTSASNIQFSNDTYRQLITIGIDDKFLDIQLRFTHGNHLSVGQFCVVRGNGNLRRTVAVEDAGLGDAAHLLQECIAELLTTSTTDLHLRYGLAEVIARQPGLPAGWCARHHIDMLLLNELGEVERVIGLLLGSHNQRLAVIICHTDILQGCIERDGRHTQYTIRIRQYAIGKDIGWMAVEVITDTLVTQHHALRTTRGT